jgi:Fur family transcriptional regulator, peroxide stress response regulator
MKHFDQKAKENLDAALAKKGLRSTRQREQVFAALLESEDHPSADILYERVKRKMPSISLATVYNCLETLSECDLIRQINFERAPSRFCFASDQHRHHAHFHCRTTGKVIDVDLPASFIENLSQFLPEGFRIDKVDLTLCGSTTGGIPVQGNQGDSTPPSISIVRDHLETNIAI